MDAASNSSEPQLARSSLLAVTTGFPALRAVRIRRAGRFDAPDHLHHDVDVRVRHDRAGIGGEDVPGHGHVAFAGEASDRHGGHLEVQPGSGSDAPGVVHQQVSESASYVAAAEQANPQSLNHAPKGSSDGSPIPGLTGQRY